MGKNVTSVKAGFGRILKVRFRIVGAGCRAVPQGSMGQAISSVRTGGTERRDVLTGEQETRQEHPQGYYTGKVSLKFIFKRETVSFQDRLNMETLGGRSFFQNRVIFWG